MTEDTKDEPLLDLLDRRQDEILKRLDELNHDVIVLLNKFSDGLISAES
jgi:hypothetical protein